MHVYYLVHTRNKTSIMTRGHHDTLIQKHIIESEDEQLICVIGLTEQQNKVLTYT